MKKLGPYKIQRLNGNGRWINLSVYSGSEVGAIKLGEAKKRSHSKYSIRVIDKNGSPVIFL